MIVRQWIAVVGLAAAVIASNHAGADDGEAAALGLELVSTYCADCRAIGVSQLAGMVAMAHPVSN
jgi:hypothetical protein